jgi:threonine synthase
MTFTPPETLLRRPAVEAATGVRPALPAHLSDLLDRRERFAILPNDQAAVEGFVRARTRATGATANGAVA